MSLVLHPAPLSTRWTRPRVTEGYDNGFRLPCKLAAPGGGRTGGPGGFLALLRRALRQQHNNALEMVWPGRPRWDIMTGLVCDWSLCPVVVAATGVRLGHEQGEHHKRCHTSAGGARPQPEKHRRGRAEGQVCGGDGRERQRQVQPGPGYALRRGEGQRRYVESFTAYARQFLERMDRPDVDRIENIPPAIAIEQKNPVKNRRSTVGTATEVNDYLRLLFARVGRMHCPQCGRPVQCYTVGRAVEKVLSLPEGTRFMVTFPLKLSSKLGLRKERRNCGLGKRLKWLWTDWWSRLRPLPGWGRPSRRVTAWGGDAQRCGLWGEKI